MPLFAGYHSLWDFGLEASLPALVLCTATGVIMVIMAARPRRAAEVEAPRLNAAYLPVP